MKATGNPRTRERMWSNIDMNTGAMIRDDATISGAGERVSDEVLAVVDGKRTGVETCRIEGFAITEVHPHELAKMRGKRKAASPTGPPSCWPMTTA